jgi:hypothetical protein
VHSFCQYSISKKFVLGDKTFYYTLHLQKQNYQIHKWKKYFGKASNFSISILPIVERKLLFEKHNKQQSCNKLITTILAPMSCFTESQIDTIIVQCQVFPFFFFWEKICLIFEHEKKQKKKFHNLMISGPTP